MKPLCLDWFSFNMKFCLPLDTSVNDGWLHYGWIWIYICIYIGSSTNNNITWKTQRRQKLSVSTFTCSSQHSTHQMKHHPPAFQLEHTLVWFLPTVFTSVRTHVKARTGCAALPKLFRFGVRSTILLKCAFTRCGPPPSTLPRLLGPSSLPSPSHLVPLDPDPLQPRRR